MWGVYYTITFIIRNPQNPILIIQPIRVLGWGVFRVKDGRVLGFE